jgi:signal transduction histidine kinase
MSRSLVVDLRGAASAGATASRRPSLAHAALYPLELDLLDELEASFARFDGRPETAAAFQAAAERARTFADAAGGGLHAQHSAALLFAADALAAVAPERASLTETAEDMVSTLAAIVELAPEAVALELFVRAASSPSLHALPPPLTIELQLRLLLALAPVSDVSLWIDDEPQRALCVAQLGDTPSTRRVRNLARAVLDGVEDGSGGERGTICGVAVLRWQQRHAVIVARARPEDRLRTRAFLNEAAARLGPVFEREMLLERNAEHERGLVEAREKRLLRLGFDLHDGPLQDLVALASDVHLAQQQIGEHVRGRTRKLVAGRFEDIGAQIGELDAKLRDLAHSLEPAGIVDRPLVEVLRREVESFERRSGIAARLESSGSFDSLTVSQRIAVYRIVQESLSNVRNHSEATDVRVTVRNGRSGIEAEIVDNGKGFSVESTLIAAAKRGRLGLVGIGERVRMLEGSLEIESGPGGPTRVMLKLPLWQPPAAS